MVKIEPVYHNKKLTGFQKVKANGQKQFLAAAQWPSEAKLRARGIDETHAEIKENNRRMLMKARRVRRKTRRSKKSKSRSRRRLSPHEKAFRKHYQRRGETKTMRPSMMYSLDKTDESSSSIPDAPPRPEAPSRLSLGAAVRKTRRRRKSTKSRRSSTRRRKTKSRSRRRKSKSRSKKSRIDSRAWASKKNQVLRRMLKKEFGRDVSRREFLALPDRVQREFQLQAYERAYPKQVVDSPDELLSNKALAKRVEKRNKAAAKRRASYTRAPREPDGQYPGEAQALHDFIDYYARKPYKTEAARLAAMRRDLDRTAKKVLKRSTSYNAWKANVDKYDLGGIDTADSDDEFLESYRQKIRK